MTIFKKNLKEESGKIQTPQQVKLKTELNERPRICCIDIDDSALSLLTSSGFNVYAGTLGKKIKVPNKNIRDNHQLLLEYDFPPNIHEYDIFIIDLDNSKSIDYKSEDHVITNHTGKSVLSLLSSFPETIFDPKPLCSKILGKRLDQIGKRPHMIIVFTTPQYIIEYQTLEITEGSISRQPIERHSIYSFAGYLPLLESKYGKEMNLCNMRSDLKDLIQSFIKNGSYNQTFSHPTVWENNARIPDPNYMPLIKNSSEEIVSFIESKENSLAFYFPQIELKGLFLNSFLLNIAPDLMAELFPFSTTFIWKQDEEYWLPNHKRLLTEKESLEKEYEEKIKLKDNEISVNYNQYNFLHEILTETGDKLVNSVILYLEWLGFKNVAKVDEMNPENRLLEEDIHIEIENGLLIIECKGLGGTSTDSDCSQISKIKHRKCKERNRFDVFALYIVNHQRYLPPLSRQTPPFTPIQIQDAINDERGLLSTWQFFNLYNDIESGIIDKEIARKELLKFGYIEFRPKNIFLIDEPKEFFKNGEVCIVNISNLVLNVGDEVFLEKNGKFQKAVIEGIQCNDKPVNTANSGELGLKLSIPIKKKTTLWKKASS
jgi:hypothetical protein